jgi:hypothetical protein
MKESPLEYIRKPAAAQRETLALLTARAQALRAQLKLRTEQMRPSGLVLRADLQAAEQLMNLQLKDASQAIETGQVEQANRSLKAAEQEIDRLEKLLRQ